MIGQRLGPYEVLAKLGEGGMGEVYRARDAKLGRDVALKILPEAFARDPERLARFEREAKTLATLNHPHIAQIYGFEESGAVHALVMELVEGPTLAERIAHGPLPLADAVAIAKQIADALEAAHEIGIVHRDLKPANIKVRDDGTVKVLDFGLAKAVDPTSSIGGAMNSPTLSIHATQMGVILGTAAYMAPEQARGKGVDRRADIWAFGVVLFEMLAGARAFEGEEISDTLASVLKEDPKWSALPPNLPPAIARLLRRCLEKDPRQRLSAIGDARLELNEPDDMRPARAAVQGASRVPWIAAAVLASLLTGVATWLVLSSTSRSTQRAQPARLTILSPENLTIFPDSSSPVLSPDGRMIAIVTGQTSYASADHLTGIWIRSIDSLNVQRLAGTEGGFLPFWSPDGQQLAFFSNDRKLKKIRVPAGRVEEICDAPDGRGGTWNGAGQIVFAAGSTGSLMRVPASGGTPQVLTTLDASREETGHRFPTFLPDGEHFLFSSVPMRAGDFDIFVGSMSDSKRQLLLSAQSTPVFSGGYLLFIRKGGLVAQRFDTTRLELVGEPLALPDAPGAIGNSYMAAPAVSSSTGAAMVYLATLPSTSLVWLEQSGREIGKVAMPPSRYNMAALARDGRRAVVVRSISPTSTDLWIADLQRGGATRLPNASGYSQNAVWSLDGDHVIFSSSTAGPRDIYTQSIAVEEAPRPLYRSKTLAKDPTSLSPDGQLLVYIAQDPVTNWDLWILPLRGGTEPRPYVRTTGNESSGAISPDGRWAAYASDETGQSEVYVQSFPTPGRKYQVTSTGASRAWWRSDGRQLLFANHDRTQIFVADVEPGADFSTRTPTVVGRLPKGVVWMDVTLDLKKLLVILNDGADVSGSVTVVQNWTAALEKR